jgi:pilus assembly protein CpaC
MSKRASDVHCGIILAVLALVVLTVSPAIAPPTWAAGPASAQQAAQQAPPGELHLLVGRSLVLTSPTPLTRVSVADPAVADALVVTPTQVLVNGKEAGAVSLVLWDENGQSQSFDVYVDLDVTAIAQKVREAFPNEPISIEATKGVVTVSGQVSSTEEADRILKVVQGIAPKVVSLMQVPPPPPPAEILLDVKFAEVDRSALGEFGINLLAPGTQPSGPGSTVGSLGTQQFAPPRLNSLTVTPSSSGGSATTAADFALSDLLNMFVFRPDIDLAATIRALSQKNVLQILASPNLLTQSGKEASFLAGGEFPYPVLQGGTVANAVTIQFREFGVRLTFLPTMDPDGRIHLKVTPEVSALDFSNALTISGFTIPALSTRRVQTEMDLKDGQSFAIAGLVDDRLTRVASKIPGLGDIPVLGHLFQSYSLNKTKTELLVMVTPRIVKPYEQGQAPAGPQFPEPFLPPVAPETTPPSNPGPGD